MKFFVLPRAGTAAGLIAVGLLLNAVTVLAEVRAWTDDLNRTWQGEFLRVDGSSAVFLVGGKEYPFPMAHLSAADKLIIFKLRRVPAAATTAAEPNPAASSGNNPASASAGIGTSNPSGDPAKAGSFGSVQVEPGNTVETDLPLASKDSQTITQAYGTQTPVTHIRASLAVPANFEGDKPQKVLVVVVTASGNDLSIPVAKRTYTKDALSHGWLVLAADGPDGKPKLGVTPTSGDTPHYRLALLQVALAELNARFPKAKTDWTFATAGFSGGCGYAGHEALWLSTQGYRVTGIMMLNCNYPPTMWEHDPDMHGNTSHWHQIPAFFSWGEKDNVAKPEWVKQAIDTTKHGGYQKVRAEMHPGHHEAWDPHINLALEWFDSMANGSVH